MITALVYRLLGRTTTPASSIDAIVVGMSTQRKEPWYPNGLRFECQRSGNCCSGPPGRVWFDPDELTRMANRLGVLPFEFLDRYAIKLDGRYSLRELPAGKGQFDCVFLTRDGRGRGGCQIYQDRPAQCRTWPFWKENLETRANWRRAAKGCPGINQGKRFSIDQIHDLRDETPLD